MAISYTHVLWGRLSQLVCRPIRQIDNAEEQYDSKQKIKKQICHFQISVKLSQKELVLTKAGSDSTLIRIQKNLIKLLNVFALYVYTGYFFN